MSHPEQMQFVASVKNLYPELFHNKTILEVGSLNVNGTVRDFFTSCNYLGIDMGEGPMVDLVCSGHELDHPDQTYHVAISTECFEHNPFWSETFQNMIRMTKVDGLVIVTCATTGRPEHGTSRSSPNDAPLIPWDYYKNLTEEDFRSKFDLDKLFKKYNFSVNMHTKDLYFFGIRS